MKELRSLRYLPGVLSILNQKELPTREIWIEAKDVETAAVAIESMAVRGAPALATCAAYGVCLWLHSILDLSLPWSKIQPNFLDVLKRLRKTRPTAVNLFHVLDDLEKVSHQWSSDQTVLELRQAVEVFAMKVESLDLATCKSIGVNGMGFFKEVSKHKLSILTHCNTGSLATAGYGTALGIIRSLHTAGRLSNVLVDETRPYLQGSRLTAFELSYEGIPYKIISDNMAAYAMLLGQVDAVIVGADRVVSNGDTANKIGTYSLAALCSIHQIPFVVACPEATIDRHMKSGAEIHVEERPESELTSINGQLIAPEDARCWNPSFDVTPSKYITAIVTEERVYRPAYKFSRR